MQKAFTLSIYLLDCFATQQIYYNSFGSRVALAHRGHRYTIRRSAEPAFPCLPFLDLERLFS